MACCSGVKGLEPGDLIQVGEDNSEEEEEEEEEEEQEQEEEEEARKKEDKQPLIDEFGDLASIMTEIEGSESDDSDTSEEDPDLEALLGLA